MIRVSTLKYEASHGHTPRQPRGMSVSPWAFEIDQDPQPVVITASYKDALRRPRGWRGGVWSSSPNHPGGRHAPNPTRARRAPLIVGGNRGGICQRPP